MKYIEEISLKNFQSHKNTNIKFNKGLNIIVGPSDSGKTAILRAIKWVLYNEPLGDYFIREGETNCSVKITFNNGVKVERYRDRSKNQYNIYLGDEVMTFEGFGSSVPLEVKEAIGIDKIELDQKESRSINLAEQLDGPFLISEKDSIKASSIGRLVGANIVDDALRESLKDSRNISQVKNQLEEENLGLNEEIKSFTYIDKIEEKILILEKILEDIKSKEVKKEKLSRILEEYSTLKSLKGKDLVLIKSLENIGGIDIRKIEVFIKTYTELVGKKSSLEYIEKALVLQNKLLDGVKNIGEVSLNIENLGLAIKKLSYLTNLSNKFKEVYLEKKKLDALNESLKDVTRIDTEKIDVLIQNYRNINRINTRWKDIKTSITSGRQYLSKLDGLKIVEKNYNDLDEIIKLYTKISILYEKHKSNLQSFSLGRDFMEEEKSKTIKLLGEYKNLLRQAEVCPFCLSSISENHIDEIISKYLEEEGI